MELLLSIAQAKAGQITLEQAQTQLDYQLNGKWVSWDEAVKCPEQVIDVRWHLISLDEVKFNPNDKEVEKDASVIKEEK